MHTHSAPPAKRFQKIVEPALTQRHSDVLTSVVRSSEKYVEYCNIPNFLINQNICWCMLKLIVSNYQQNADHDLNPNC